MKKLTEFYRYLLPPIIWAIVIFVESSIPDLTPPSLGITFQDKIAHAIVFGILGFLITRAFYNNSNGTLQKNAILFGIIVGSAYGIMDEVYQSVVPGRYAEVGDAIADFVGIILAQIFFVYKRKFN